jgi:hypothetical protein
MAHAVHISNFLPSAILIDLVGARGRAACRRLLRALIHFCTMNFNWKLKQTFHFATSHSHDCFKEKDERDSTFSLKVR